MPEINRDRFEDFWRKTEVIREYARTLFTFGHMRLPYVFAAEHTRFSDRVVVRKGVVMFEKPQILLPGYFAGPKFAEGFEHAGALPPNAVYIWRAMGLPYSHVSNRVLVEQQIEYGGLQEVIDKFHTQMEASEDAETGLIKGALEGADVSIMRYSVGLAIKSAGENAREYIEHLKRQRGESIQPHETITDEDIRRLFE
ncbi:MAG: hypothetical protein QF662_00205 [Phycisphaerae bacterium]|jgi:hypothetical protein|nr:hypothetical protein [Phycisphaerae bacterium]